MKNLLRIVTFMGYPSKEYFRSPIAYKTEEYSMTDKVRLFAVRKVVYDDAMTPIYSVPAPYEQPCKSLAELTKKVVNLRLFDAPILDVDNNLKVYDYYEIRDN